MTFVNAEKVIMSALMAIANCYENCAICNSYTFCIECIDGFELKNDFSTSSICVQKCKNRDCQHCKSYNECSLCTNNYILDENGNCCDSSCLTCSESSHYCESCPDGKYLENHYCNECHIGCNNCSNFNICYNCDLGYNLEKSKCIKNNSPVLSKFEFIIILSIPIGGFLLIG